MEVKKRMTDCLVWKQEKAVFELLKIFAFGNYADYVGKKKKASFDDADDGVLAASGSLPALTPAQKVKLQRLTIVSLSAQSHVCFVFFLEDSSDRNIFVPQVLSYTLLQKELSIDNVRELEDLVIEAIYSGVIQGRIDQRNQQFEIHFAIGRDVQPAELDSLMQTLLTWYDRLWGQVDWIHGFPTCLRTGTRPVTRLSRRWRMWWALRTRST
jgi:COP9 signalosome complex subunit 7